MAQDKHERAFSAKAGAQALVKPKKTAEPFVMLPFEVLKSAAYESLGYSERAILIELVHFYYGSNNGQIWLSEAMLKQRGFSMTTARRSLKNLLLIGFIYQTKMGGSQKGHCNWYALTWLPIDKAEGMVLDCYQPKKFLKFFPKEKNNPSNLTSTPIQNDHHRKVVALNGNRKQSLSNPCDAQNGNNVTTNLVSYIDLCQSIGKEESKSSKMANSQNWIAQDQARLKEIGLAGAQSYQLPTIH